MAGGVAATIAATLTDQTIQRQRFRKDEDEDHPHEKLWLLSVRPAQHISQTHW